MQEEPQSTVIENEEKAYLETVVREELVYKGIFY